MQNIYKFLCHDMLLKHKTSFLLKRYIANYVLLIRSIRNLQEFDSSEFIIQFAAFADATATRRCAVPLGGRMEYRVAEGNKTNKQRKAVPSG